MLDDDERANADDFDEEESADAADFETFDLLDAVGHVDHARGYLNDSDICRPPQLRIDLLELHGLAMNALNYKSSKEKRRDVRDRALELSDQIADVLEHLEAAHKTLEALLRVPELARLEDEDDEG